MILRFSKEDDMDTSYAAWRLRTPAPYSIRAVVKTRVAHLPMEAWVEFLDRHPIARDDFEYEVKGGKLNFVIVVLTGSDLKEVILEPPGARRR